MMYKLDRTAFKAHTATEATKMHAAHYQTISWQERLRIADYLNSIAYNYPTGSPPKMDRTKFVATARK